MNTCRDQFTENMPVAGSRLVCLMGSYGL